MASNGGIRRYLWQVLVCGILCQHDWADFGAIKCCRRCDSLRVPRV